VKGVEKLFKFAVAAPAISIPAVLVFNYFFFMSPIVAWFVMATFVQSISLSVVQVTGSFAT